MARITKKLCDRCGEEMFYIGWTSFFRQSVKKIGKHIFIRQLYNGNPSGYDYYDCNYELCMECTKKLKSFLREHK